MKITAMDGNKCACVHIKLDSDKFEQYQCNSNMVTAGVNMSSLFKLVKTMELISFSQILNKLS